MPVASPAGLCVSITSSPLSAVGGMLGATLIVLLVLPLGALALSTSIDELLAEAADPMFAPALWLSLKTTLSSLALITLMGTPLAWWLATSSSRAARITEILVDLPIVLPPAVVGVALLQTFGRQGLLGPMRWSCHSSSPPWPRWCWWRLA